MLSEAIEYPLEGDDAMERFLLGGALFLLSPFVVPSILLGGYAVAVVRAVFEGRTEPPGFDDWGALLRDGLSVLAISVVYWLPGLVLAGLGLGLFVITSVVAADATDAVFVLLSGVGTIVGFGYALAVAYLLPAAIVNFARTGSIGAAWDVDALRTVITNGDFARAWVAAAVVLLVTNTLGGTLTAFLIGFVVFYYGQVAATYLYARGAMASLGVEPEPPTPPSAPEGDEGDASQPPDDSSAGTAPAGDDSDADDSDGDGEPATKATDESGGAEPDDGDGRDLTDVDGIGPSTAESLRETGFESVDDLRDASRDDLVAVDGIGPAKADQIKRDV